MNREWSTILPLPGGGVAGNYHGLQIWRLPCDGGWQTGGNRCRRTRTASIDADSRTSSCLRPGCLGTGGPARAMQQNTLPNRVPIAVPLVDRVVGRVLQNACLRGRIESVEGALEVIRLLTIRIFVAQGHLLEAVDDVLLRLGLLLHGLLHAKILLHALVVLLNGLGSIGLSGLDVQVVLHLRVAKGLVNVGTPV